MLDHFRMLAGYNAWANRRLYAAAGALADADYRADHGAFFRSVHGTLNHLLAADRIWMRRFTGTGDAPDRLDAILAEDFVALDALRAAEDARIRGYVDGLDAATLAGLFTYRPITRPDAAVTQPLAPALAHVFNHQTHHRGQVHALLTRIAGSAPELDLIFYQRETGIGMA